MVLHGFPCNPSKNGPCKLSEASKVLAKYHKISYKRPAQESKVPSAVRRPQRLGLMIFRACGASGLEGLGS